MISEAPPDNGDVASCGNDNGHQGGHEHIDHDDAAARIEVAHRNDEEEAEGVANLRDNGYQVGLSLTHMQVGADELQERLIVITVGHRESGNDGHSC